MALALFGVDPILAALVFWLGGAVATLGLGAHRAARAGAPHDGRDDGDEVFAEALRRWEADRAADSLAVSPVADDLRPARPSRR